MRGQEKVTKEKAALAGANLLSCSVFMNEAWQRDFLTRCQAAPRPCGALDL
ncbi:MAG: hypothetical protein OEZ39_13550 [Gammaproteobacteria bacterium]|nr:hypothetical protein [Gammaproteobacteria bacterium]